MLASGAQSLSFLLRKMCSSVFHFPSLFVALKVSTDSFPCVSVCMSDCSFAIGIAQTRGESLTSLPPPLHPQPTWLILGLTPKPLSGWFVTRHWLPVFGCDHPSHCDNVSSAPGPVTLALREPEDLASQFWWPLQCLPSLVAQYELLVCSGFELAQ